MIRVEQADGGGLTIGGHRILGPLREGERWSSYIADAPSGRRVELCHLLHPDFHRSSHRERLRGRVARLRNAGLSWSRRPIAWVDEEIPVVTLDVLEGITLEDAGAWCQRVGELLPVGAVLDIAEQLCRAGTELLRAAPTPGDDPLLVELSPWNIGLARDGSVLLLPLGLALEHFRVRRSPAQTAWLPPECLDGPPLGESALCWGLGVLLWEFTMGEPLLPHGTAAERQQMLRVWTREDALRQLETRPDIPDAMATLVGPLLARDPASRGTLRDAELRLRNLREANAVRAGALTAWLDRELPGLLPPILTRSGSDEGGRRRLLAELTPEAPDAERPTVQVSSSEIASVGPTRLPVMTPRRLQQLGAEGESSSTPPRRATPPRRPALVQARPTPVGGRTTPSAGSMATRSARETPPDPGPPSPGGAGPSRADLAVVRTGSDLPAQRRSRRRRRPKQSLVWVALAAGIVLLVVGLFALDRPAASANHLLILEVDPPAAAVRVADTALDGSGHYRLLLPAELDVVEISAEMEGYAPLRRSVELRRRGAEQVVSVQLEPSASLESSP